MGNKNYVVGFLFDDKENVALIRKNYPEWQAGKLNGIGGHVEKGETSLNAMIREFREETGLDIHHWKHFATISGSTYRLEVYMTRLNWQNELEPERDIESVTDEIVGWYPVNNLPLDIIPNLKWIIPLADYKEEIFAQIHHESETC